MVADRAIGTLGERIEREQKTRIKAPLTGTGIRPALIVSEGAGFVWLSPART
jgi:hypothetical protein